MTEQVVGLDRFMLALTLALCTVVAAWSLGAQSAVPRCQEDAVLVGVGDFEAGRWTGYACGPSLDDFDLRAGL